MFRDPSRTLYILGFGGCPGDTVTDRDYTRCISTKNFACTIDCSGHNAGYEWAKKKGITNPNECTGKSNSFLEGCRVAASE